MSGWHLDGAVLGPAARESFRSLEAAFSLTGQRVTQDQISDVVLVRADGRNYFVKRYGTAGKYLRRFLGMPRIAAEWRNLQRFAQWGIPTARVVAWGLERTLGLIFRRGAMVTEEIPGTVDLLRMARSGDPRLRQRAFVARLSADVAQIVRTLHGHRFAHNDLHWRNLLYQEESGRIFLIDCPTGRFWHGPLLNYRVAKDLAALDNTARIYLSRTQRLRFYLDYAGKTRLDETGKKAIRHVMHAAEHRRRRKQGKA
ncbi:lipopolysaccharide kinase InaA family protein [Pseudothauera rhizosphaerae]|uniref:Heptose kinase n=1 Tax=Pseudothauera rhizosphaerae TaxID=2565932 RepID=A0A4S4AH65_9RHOO|nr:lipopolysaccharide kinase InaA family protein [Pseudothauera rhizosphaerae]THF57664.1 heptose kinase [Pseudothauera rhizosphaerae]